jgi:hypothetical protein
MASPRKRATQGPTRRSPPHTKRLGDVQGSSFAGASERRRLTTARRWRSVRDRAQGPQGARETASRSPQ